MEQTQCKEKRAWVTLRDGRPVYTCTWTCDSPHRATVIFLHGFADHIHRYDHIFPILAKAGIKVHAYDMRGFGRTGRRFEEGALLGHSEGYKKSLGDVEEAVRRCCRDDEDAIQRRTAENGGANDEGAMNSAELGLDVKGDDLLGNENRRRRRPIFLWGQSYGGGLALNYAAIGQSRNLLSGVLASSPLIGVASRAAPPEAQLLLAGIASKFLPSLTINSGLSGDNLSHDPTIKENYLSDFYVHDLLSIESVTDMIYNGRALQKWRCQEIRVPMYVSHGTADEWTDFEATRCFMEKVRRATDKTFRVYRGAYHEVHNEPAPLGNHAIQDIVAWIYARI